MHSHPPRQAPSRTLLILGAGTLAFVLAQTTVIPALGDLQRQLGASATGIAWMVTAYLLVASVATPILGRLGDMFGKERLLATTLALFAVGSIVCARSDSLAGLIVGRGLQGLGGGVFPLSFGIIRDEFPREKVPTGIARLRLGLGLGAVLTTNVSTVLIGSAMIGTFVLVPQLAQLPQGGDAGFGLSATQAGLLLAPGSLVSLLIAPLVGRVGARHGSKP